MLRIHWSVVVALVLACGVAVWLVVANRPKETTASAPADVGERLEERLDELEARMKSLANTPRVRIAAPQARPADGREAAPGAAPVKEEERPATIEEVRKFLAERLKDDERPAEHRFQLSVGDSGTKSLDDAAKELSLPPHQVQRVQEAFHAEGEAQLKAVFGTDDIEAIRQRIRQADTDPAARTELQDMLLTNLVKALPKIRRAEEGKIAALKETLGKDTYEKFRRLSVAEGATDEFDALLEKTLGQDDEGGK